MTYQVEFMIRMPAYPKGFQWDYKYILVEDEKEVIRKAFNLLRMLRKEKQQEVISGKRKPEHALVLAITRITRMGKIFQAKTIYKRKRKFGNHIP